MTGNRAIHAALSLSIALSGAAAVAAADANRDLVVRIAVTQRPPNLYQPWTKAAAKEVSGSGFVIEGRRILTNSHVIQHASQIYVQPHQSAEKIPANVIAADPEIDLAILSLEDASFFESRPPIQMAEELPEVKSTVNVYGYPVGGEQLSVTEGIVSRIDYAPYYFGTGGLRLQIDAALNPGNSGGPALAEGRLVGVAFSGLKTADNIGYLIPVEEVRSFLNDIADGVCDGKPQLRGQFQTVENEAIRAKLGLAGGQGGVMVDRTDGTDESHTLQEGDVITHIAGTPLDNASRVRVSGDLQLPFQYLVPKVAKNGKLSVTLKRGDQTLAAEVPVSSHEKYLVPYLRGGYPRYFIHGPLVFSTVSREMMIGLGAAWGVTLLARGDAFLNRLNDHPVFEGEELVVVPSPMFSHRITKGYSHPTLGIVESMNGIHVRSLRHLAELLRDNHAEYVELKFSGRGLETLVFRSRELADSTEEILNDNGIRKRASDDLVSVWDEKQKAE